MDILLAHLARENDFTSTGVKYEPSSTNFGGQHVLKVFYHFHFHIIERPINNIVLCLYEVGTWVLHVRSL